MPDELVPQAGGWNRNHFNLEDIGAEVARLRAAGLTFCNDIVSAPGGRQILARGLIAQPDRALPGRWRPCTGSRAGL